MPDAWLTEPFLGGSLTLVPSNPAKGMSAALRVEVTAPYQALYLRGPALRALLGFIEKNRAQVQVILDQ